MEHAFPTTSSVRPRTVLLLPALILAGAMGFVPRARCDDDPPAARFRAVNGSRYAIQGVYACSPRAASWGTNLIEGRLLEPSRDTVVVLPGGCGVYDMRFVAEDGIEYLEDEVPFCGDDAEAAAAAAEVGPQDDSEDVVTLGRNDLVKARRARGAAGGSDGGRER